MLTRFLPLEIGLSCVGDGMPCGGRLKNLHGFAVSRQSVRLEWDPDEDIPARVIAYVDGLPRGDADVGQRGVSISSLGAGDQSIQPLIGYQRETPSEQLIDIYGQNALLFWEPSPSSDCIGYRVYDVTSSPQLVEEITEMTVHERVLALPDEGSGTGRISFWGAPPADMAINGIGTIELMGLDPDTGEMIADWYFGSELPESYRFMPGSVLSLPLGVAAAFQDPVGNYQSGDVWHIHIGPKCQCVTQVLAPGDYMFGVSAIDAAGNETASIESVGIHIMNVPEPVSNVTMAIEAGMLRASFNPPSAIDGINVYCNFNPHTGMFEDYIQELGLPFETLDSDATEWEFDPDGAEGRLLFVLRPFNTECERPDGIIHEFGFPADPGDLGVVLKEPTGLTAVPTAAGKWKLEWDYRPARGEGQTDGATEFHIYRHSPGSEDIDYDNDLLATVMMSAGIGRPARHFVYNYTGAAETGEIKLAVRASDGTLEGGNTEYVILIPDAVAPEFAGPVYGGSA